MNDRKKLFWKASWGCFGLIVFAVLWKLAGAYFKPDDLWQVQRWWAVLLLLGIGFFPLSAFLFRQFSDKGYIFGKVLGLVISGWLVWVLSCMHIVKFSTVGSYVLLGLCIVANYGLVIYFCKKKKVRLGEFFGVTDGSAVITRAIWYEVLFFAVFAALLYVKCFRPDFSWQTEGGMDYGFMISMLKSDYMPPEDFWYSGTDLNYYYLGQYFYTYLTKLSGVTINAAYNLALMTVGALCMVLSYSLAARIFELYMKERTKEYGMLGKQTVASVPLLQQIFPRFAGLLAGCGVTFACTNHYWLYQKVAPAICDILGVEGNHSYWIGDPTRYIGWQGEALDQTIHEFPAYSIVLGDLHAHVTNIVFVITLLALLFAFLLTRGERMKMAVAGSLETVSYKKELLQPHIIILSFFIGIFQMTNYWDFPIYFVVCGAVILVSNAVVCGFTKKSLLLTAVHAAEFIVISYVTAFMFNIKFESMAQGIGICDRHTAPYQMIVVWGLPIVAVIAYLVASVKEEQARRKGGVSETEHKNVFYAWLQNLKLSDLFLLIIGLCAIGLILMPELIYIRDIYGAVNQRTNTMFKLTYQAFILFGIFMGCMITRYFLLPKNGKQFVAGGLMLFLLCRNLEFFPYAWNAWAGDYKNPENYISLNATDNNTDLSETNMAVVEWVNENIEGRPTILQAHGTSYRTAAPDYFVYNWLSALTGCPTVVGWHTHEWLWKNDVAAVNARANDVQTMYTCFDIKKAASYLTEYGVASDGSVGDAAKKRIKEVFGVTVDDTITLETATVMLTMLGVDQSVYYSPEFSTSLLEQYDVDYLYVGELEFMKYGRMMGGTGLDYDYLRSLGEVVFEGPDESNYYQTFIVKLK